ncbi:LLM class flavin-dependent oxidoreductase [Actinokineospora globicatena]|uniref:N5,N10-methylene tetrahydromethanopterin reductase n=1 Tax=Actinokineospora globicatena TaxID=103729 RepID=A0A9W6QR52_9PSEU|nr:LLM class flavin-dependent oxidoreductase [Actinokineospora globicatena]GLW93208.1 N5,N10-methylene tetrahydromethanopterin reductase [Actinokineospora globicatena]
MSLGYLLPTFAAEPESLVELGGQAEEAGFDTVWVPDSPLVYGLPDPLALLSALAATTHRVTLATGVLLGALRHPVLLAHSLATLDRLSSGRLVVGLGSGFTAPETERQFTAAGIPFHNRGTRLTETITVLRTLWSGGTTHEGHHFTFQDVTLSPKPHTPTGPPIWLAGAGPRAERRVAELADGWLPYLPTVDSYRAALRRIQDAAEKANRTPPIPALYATVAVDRSEDAAHRRLRTVVEQWYGYPFDTVSTLQAMYAGTPSGLRTWLDTYRQAGARHISLRIADDHPQRGLETLAAATL